MSLHPTQSNAMRRAPTLCVLLAACVVLAGCAGRRAGHPFQPPAAGAMTVWQGYDRSDFVLDGRPCVVVSPRQVAPGTPWVWRASFFGERPEVDLALLAHGFHLVYMEVTDLCGSPAAVVHWDALYRYLTQQQGFAAQPALIAISRGALIAYNWAAANPDRVACIYADIPVCDFKSWPGGMGSGHGDPGEWRRCLAAYGLSEAQALQYAGNPIDNLAPLARAGVRLLHTHGAADDVVPLAENTAVVERRYKALGGDITVIIKPGAGHQSGVDDPQPIIDFILTHTPGG